MGKRQKEISPTKSKTTPSRVKSSPTRTCVICRQKFLQQELERFTSPTPDTFLPDAGQKKEGRGYYFCQSPVCQERKLRFRPGRKIKNGAKKHNES